MSILYMLWNPSVDMSLKCHFSHSPGQDPVALGSDATYLLVEAGLYTSRRDWTPYLHPE